jgi:hypothetical protein
LSIDIKIHPLYQILTDNRAVVEVEGNTVLDCLKCLLKQYPQLEKELFKDDGTLVSIATLFLNKEIITNELLSKSVSEPDGIRIEIFIAGG